MWQVVQQEVFNNGSAMMVDVMWRHQVTSWRHQCALLLEKCVQHYIYNKNVYFLLIRTWACQTSFDFSLFYHTVYALEMLFCANDFIRITDTSTQIICNSSKMKLKVTRILNRLRIILKHAYCKSIKFSVQFNFCEFHDVCIFAKLISSTNLFKGKFKFWIKNGTVI